MGDEFSGRVGAFLITLFAIPFYGLAVIFLIRKMIMKELDFLPGFMGCLVVTAFAALTISPPHPALPGILIISMVSLYVTLPFAATQLAKLEFRRINKEQMSKLIQAVVARPENHSAAFELAEGLYRAGYRGHAIALAENTLGGLSTTMDPVKGTTMRGFFMREEQRLKRWKLAGGDPRLFAPVACPSCGTVNEPGWTICKKCQRPYLLDALHQTHSSKKFIARVVVAWLAIAVVAPLAGIAPVLWPGVVSIVVIVATLAVIGGVLAWLFKPPLGDGTDPNVDI